jgi:hypothetical protein
MLPTQKILEQIVKELQKIMRLQDWDIETRVISRLEMLAEQGEVNCCGVSIRDLHQKCAKILLNKDHEEMQASKDWYFTLIHEMYHINTTYLIDRAESVIKCLHNSSLEDYTMSFLKQEYEKSMNEFAKIFTSLYPAEQFLLKIYEIPLPEEGEING